MLRYGGAAVAARKDKRWVLQLHPPLNTWRVQSWNVEDTGWSFSGRTKCRSSLYLSGVTTSHCKIAADLQVAIWEDPIHTLRQSPLHDNPVSRDVLNQCHCWVLCAVGICFWFEKPRKEVTHGLLNERAGLRGLCAFPPQMFQQMRAVMMLTERNQITQDVCNTLC